MVYWHESASPSDVSISPRFQKNPCYNRHGSAEYQDEWAGPHDPDAKAEDEQ